MEFTYEMAGANLKLKYRIRRPVTKHGAKSSNSGSSPAHGSLPHGIPRHYRGKTKHK